MNKFLKSTVIILGLIIIILFSFTILTIFSKYDNLKPLKQNLKLDPSIKTDHKILNFEIKKNKLYIQLETISSQKRLIRVYELNDGKLISEIILN